MLLKLSWRGSFCDFNSASVSDRYCWELILQDYVHIYALSEFSEDWKIWVQDDLMANIPWKVEIVYCSRKNWRLLSPRATGLHSRLGKLWIDLQQRESEAVFLGFVTGVAQFCKEHFYFIILACFQSSEEVETWALEVGSPGFESGLLHQPAM